jgi:hypothetical protein
LSVADVLAALWIGASGLLVVLSMAGLMLGLEPGSALVLAVLILASVAALLTWRPHRAPG